MMKEKPQPNRDLLLRYAGMGAQMLVSMGIAAFAGYKIDKWINLNFPLLVWLLPLIVLIAILLKAIKDTSNK